MNSFKILYRHMDRILQVIMEIFYSALSHAKKYLSTYMKITSFGMRRISAITKIYKHTIKHEN